ASMADATYPFNNCPGAVLLFNKAEMIELRDRVFTDFNVQDDGATVAILNATETPDLAAYLASLLKSQGITANRVSTDELKNGPLYDRTIIVDVDGKSQTADKLAEWLQLPSSRICGMTDPDVKDLGGVGADITI